MPTFAIVLTLDVIEHIRAGSLETRQPPTRDISTLSRPIVAALRISE